MKNGFSGLAHIAIYTQDLGASIDFYERMGAEILQRGEVQKPKGINQLALLALAGFELELIEPHDGTKITVGAGAIPHLAIRVENLEESVSALRSAGIDSFQTATPNVVPDLFGGLRNWFFTGPSGEVIELLQPLEK